MIGKLSERITFQSYSLVSDGAGGNTKTWANLASIPTVWAKVEAKSAGEQFDEQRTTATGMYLFTIRERTDIDERDRIVWRGVNYNIRAVLRDGSRPQYLRIEAERGV